MSRLIVIVLILAFLSINFQSGEATFTFLCDQFRLTMNSIISLFSARRVRFFLYKNAHSNPQIISCDQNCNFRRTNFDPNLRTTLIIHGFLNDHSADWVKSLTSRLFQWQRMNIIVVDWSEIFTTNYYETAKKIVDVARQTKQLLKQLAQKKEKDLKNWPYIHIIGHSLGAHVAGQIAEQLRYDVFVHRITAFDPAKPYFDKEGSHLKLNKNVAQFVDVIHTNSAGSQETFGIHEPVGHIDFYANGGDKQPRCNVRRWRARRGAPWFWFQPLDCLSKAFFGMNFVGLKSNYILRMAYGDDMICDHGEAPNYFIESINSGTKFKAKKVATIPRRANSKCGYCSGQYCVRMGMDAHQFSHPSYHGMYYVNTECRY